MLSWITAVFSYSRRLFLVALHADLVMGPHMEPIAKHAYFYPSWRDLDCLQS